MKPAIDETVNESKVEENVDLSAVEDTSEITVPLNESLENVESTLPTETVVVLESSTETTLNETEVSENTPDDLTVATTDLDTTYTYDSDNSTYNATDTTEETTVNTTESSTANTTESSTVNTTESSIPIETVTESTTSTTTELPTTTTTTELPTTPIDILCPHIPETEIDQKYWNETLDLYLELEEYIKKNPSAKVYKSPGFPGPYAVNLNCTLRFELINCEEIDFEINGIIVSLTLSNCTGIDVVVHYLDLNPFQPDTLNIRGGKFYFVIILRRSSVV